MLYRLLNVFRIVFENGEYSEQYTLLTDLAQCLSAKDSGHSQQRPLESDGVRDVWVRWSI
jgi:hypothetical protein